MVATPPKRVKLQDIAKAMGLSPSTVSRAFTDPERGNFQTVERIMQVAHEMGYRRHPERLRLEPSASRTINLIVQDSSNQFYIHFMHGVLERARMDGYLTIVSDTGDDLRMERAYVRRFTKAVDGIIAAAPITPASELRELARNTPLVLFNREVDQVSSVVAFAAEDIWALVQHLAEHNHRRVVYCSGPKFAWSNKMRMEKIAEYSQAFGMEFRVIGPFTPTMAQGKVAAMLAVHEGPTAIMAFNDQLAVGIIQRLLAEGYSVPGDFSVTGFDNTQSASIIDPGLTCLDAPLNRAGHAAVELLLQRLAGQHEAGSVLLNADLLVRGSTGPARQD